MQCKRNDAMQFDVCQARSSANTIANFMLRTMYAKKGPAHRCTSGIKANLKSWLPWQRALKATQSCLYEARTMRLTQARSATGSQLTAGLWGTQSRPRYVGLLLGAGLWGSATVCQGRSHDKDPTKQHVTCHDAMQ